MTPNTKPAGFYWPLAAFFLLLVLALPAPGQTPQLPTTWVDNNEATDGLVYVPPVYELIFPSGWVGIAPPGCLFHLPYTNNAAGAQLAWTDAEACRTATGAGSILDMLAASLYSSAHGMVIPQSASAPATQFIVLRSTQDAQLPNGRVPGAHGIEDNLATSASGNIGLRNPDLTGNNLSFQLGTTVTSLTIAGAPQVTFPYTLANGTVISSPAAYNDLQYLWIAECTGVNCNALQLCSPLGASATSDPPKCASATLSPDHWLIEDFVARMSVGNTGNSNVLANDLAGTETSTAQLAHNIHFRKFAVLGDWTDLVHGANSVSGAIKLDCIHCSLVDFQISQVSRPGGEGHGIGLGLGSEYKIYNFWIEGQSSCIFSGGFAVAPSIAGLLPNQDTEIRAGRCTFPYSWLGQSPISGNLHGWNGSSLVRKNCFENKEGARVLVAGILCENVDGSGGQGGILGNIGPRNTSGGSTGTNYQATARDYTIENNVWRNACEGFEINAGSAPDPGDGGGVALLSSRIRLRNNLFYNVTNTNPGCAGTNSTGISLQSAPERWQGTISGNGTTATFTATCSANDWSSGSLTGTCKGQVLSGAVLTGGSGCTGSSVNLTISAPNIAGGIQAAAKAVCAGGVLAAPVTVTQPGSGYTSTPTATPASGTGTVSLTLVSSVAAPGVGYEVLDLAANQPFSITGCQTVSGYNVPTFTSGGQTFPSAVGPASASASSGLTVSYPWTGASGTDSGGYCTLTNLQGAPGNLQFIHNTFISDAVHALTSTSDNANGHGPNYAVNGLFRDSILLGGGWFNNPLGEGTASETFNYDKASLTADHLVWPGRTAANYTEFGNNASYPDTAGCTGAGCSPPATWAFPATSYCTGASSTSACVGFTGAMSASSMPLALSDYHQYGLRSDSSFHNAASDGTDDGTNLAAIDAAQNQNLYVCATPCGTTGPYPGTPLPGVGPPPPPPPLPPPPAFSGGLGDHGLAAAGSCAFTLDIFGGNFTPASVANWNGSALSTTYLYPHRLQAAIPSGDLAAGGSFPITVTDAGNTLLAETFTVVAGTPTITATFVLGGTLLLDGTNFVPRNTVVLWNGTALATSWISATRVQAWLPAGVRAIGGNSVSVSNGGCQQ